MCGFACKILQKLRKDGYQIINSGSQKGANERRGKESSPPGAEGGTSTAYFIRASATDEFYFFGTF